MRDCPSPPGTVFVLMHGDTSNRLQSLSGYDLRICLPMFCISYVIFSCAILPEHDHWSGSDFYIPWTYLLSVCLSKHLPIFSMWISKQQFAMIYICNDPHLP